MNVSFPRLREFHYRGSSRQRSRLGSRLRVPRRGRDVEGGRSDWTYSRSSGRAFSRRIAALMTALTSKASLSNPRHWNEHHLKILAYPISRYWLVYSIISSLIMPIDRSVHHSRLCKIARGRKRHGKWREETWGVKEREKRKTDPALVPSPASPLSRALQSCLILSVLSIAPNNSLPTGISLEDKANNSLSLNVNLVRKRWTRDCWTVVVALSCTSKAREYRLMESGIGNRARRK